MPFSYSGASLSGVDVEGFSRRVHGTIGIERIYHGRPLDNEPGAYIDLITSTYVE